VLSKLETFAKLGYEDALKQYPEDLNHRLKWLGIFNRPHRTPGKFMTRLRLPNGIVTSAQLRYFASVISKYDRSVGVADITTRQNIELRGLVLEDIPELIRGLRDVGVCNFQTGLDNIRNVVGSPVAGIDPQEMFDTRQLCREIDDLITGQGNGNPEFSNLPRKFNICVSGGRDDYAHTDINDIGFRPVLKDGVLGFNVVVGGYMGSVRIMGAIPLDAWVQRSEVVPLCRAILRLYRDNGSREDRKKLRMMYLIEDLGLDKFRAEVERYLGRSLERAATVEDSSWQRRDLHGVHPQKQPGLNWVGINIPVGRLHREDLTDLASLADRYSSGELRLTVEQNAIFPNVPSSKVHDLLNEPLLRRFTSSPGRLMRNLVSCTGAQFCGNGLYETKNRAMKMARDLESELDIPNDIRINWTGCPNSCAQAQLGEIGILGSGAVKDGKPVEGVDIYLGGRVGEHAKFGQLHKSSVATDDLKDVLMELLITEFGATLTPKGMSRMMVDLMKKSATTVVVESSQPKKKGKVVKLSLEEVAKHNTEASCWLAVKGNVYDVTSYIEAHPGGKEIVMAHAGTECTEEFKAVHSPGAWTMLELYKIGALNDDFELPSFEEETSSSSPATTTTAAAAPAEATNAQGEPITLFNMRKVSLPLVQKDVISPDTRVFRFALPTSQHRLGLPTGQHILLSGKVDGELVTRAYTPISCDDDLGYVDFVVKVYFANVHPKFPEGGKFTQHLEAIKLGDTIDFQGPTGHIVYWKDGLFTVKGEPHYAKRLGLIAGGSGIAPIMQVVRHILKDPEDETELHVLFANQTEADILLREELDETAAKYPDRLKVWYTLDRPSEGWQYSSGFIDEEMLKAHMPPADKRTYVLMCGPAPMIDYACLPNLHKLGFKSHQCVVY